MAAEGTAPEVVMVTEGATPEVENVEVLVEAPKSPRTTRPRPTLTKEGPKPKKDKKKV